MNFFVDFFPMLLVALSSYLFMVSKRMEKMGRMDCCYTLRCIAFIFLAFTGVGLIIMRLT